jgi:hypothetical protein
MNAQIYPFDPACQTECEGSQKIFQKRKNGMMEEWKNQRQVTSDEIRKTSDQ